jgi:hypothetical protein
MVRVLVISHVLALHLERGVNLACRGGGCPRIADKIPDHPAFSRPTLSGAREMLAQHLIESIVTGWQ